MKNQLREYGKKNTLKNSGMLLFAILILQFLIVSTGFGQYRSGSINLATTAGSGIKINDGLTGNDLDIMDGSFTIEMWVKNMENNGDFCVFNFDSRGGNDANINRFSLVHENDNGFEIE